MAFKNWEHRQPEDSRDSPRSKLNAALNECNLLGLPDRLREKSPWWSIFEAPDPARGYGWDMPQAQFY